MTPSAPPSPFPSALAVAEARPPVTARGAGSVALAYLELVKPAITRLVLVTLLCGALVAREPVRWQDLLLALVGTGLVVAAANTLNMVLERESDALMERTRGRPLPSGRLTAREATVFGLALPLLGLPLLALVNWLTAALAAAALALYVLVYTPLKRRTRFALHVGAVPGALPPLIGGAAMDGAITFGPALLFAVLLAWQLPHFLAISLFRRADYERAGLRVWPAERGVRRTQLAIVWSAATLVAVTAVPLAAGAPWPYGVAALAAGAAFLAATLRALAAADHERWARRVFLLSIPHLLVVYASFVLTAS